MVALIFTLIITANAEVGTAGFNFLKIAPSAKEAAMANAAIGFESNKGLSGFGFWYNPATSVKSPIIGATYINYLAGINYGVVGYAQDNPFSFLKSAGIGIAYLYSGPIKRTDITGQTELGTFSVSYLNLNLVGNAKLTNELDVGLGLKLLYGAIDSFNTIGVATDLGIRFKPNVKDIEGLCLGAVVRNVGYQLNVFDVERDKLPLDIGIGAGYNLTENINLALDIHKPIDNTFLFSIGAEGWVNKYIALRAGYNSLGKDYQAGGVSNIISGFSAGLGVKYQKYQVDYSFTPIGDLGRLHHITLFFSL